MYDFAQYLTLSPVFGTSILLAAPLLGADGRAAAPLAAPFSAPMDFCRLAGGSWALSAGADCEGCEG